MIPRLETAFTKMKWAMGSGVEQRASVVRVTAVHRVT